VYLETLEEGERFTSGERAGTLIRKGNSGAVVQWDGRETVEIAGKSFQRPLAPVTIALRCEVKRLEGGNLSGDGEPKELADPRPTPLAASPLPDIL
jgi:hypothetical protein